MQDNYNLLGREEEREMLPLCADEGVQTILYSPLCRSRLARPRGETTARTQAEKYATSYEDIPSDSDRKIVDAVADIANERGVSMAQIGLAWLPRNPVVAAPIVGALKAKHIDDAVVALSIMLSDDEAKRLEGPYTPRHSIRADVIVHRFRQKQQLCMVCS